MKNIFLGCNLLLAILWSYHAMAVDLDSLESTVSTQLCPAGDCKYDCDNKLAQRIGRDLPIDADSCHAKEQYRLLAKGLYRTEKGEILSLKHKFKSVVIQRNIDVPDIRQQQVNDKDSPYVIDLQSDSKNAHDKK